MKLEEINNYFQKYDDVLFALLFGSFAAGSSTSKSDIDIGIYTKDGIDLLRFGRMITDLQNITGFKIDLIELNHLFNKSPLLAHQIISNHKIILVRDESALLHFKLMTMLHYFDTEALRITNNAAFYSRITHHKFGIRNYA